jgi:hypothetical protein
MGDGSLSDISAGERITVQGTRKKGPAKPPHPSSL